MTIDATVRPFLTRFAQPLDGNRETIHRYDEVRQVSQVLVDGAWTDATKARIAVARETRVTKVYQETTDDA